MSSEIGSLAPDRKGILAYLNPRTWSIKWKILLNFLVRAVVAISLMVSAVYLSQRRSVIREASDKLLLLTDTKARYLEEYFRHIDQQLGTFTGDRQTIEAFNQLTQAFQNIESDSYFTSAVTSLDKISMLTEGFYNTDILPVLEDRSHAGINLPVILPADNKQRILQYLYLAANAKPLGSKSTLSKAEDGSAYSYMHAQYHPDILRFARQAGLTDILFVDYKTGYVTYSVQKNLDFATNLFNGPYKNSGLGMAFKSAIGQPKQSPPVYVDASLYLPAFFQPSMFIATPVYSESQLLGAVVFVLDVAVLDQLLAIEKQDLSKENSLKTLVIGPDLLYRCNDPEFLSGAKKYVRRLKYHAGNGTTASMVQRYGSTALVQQVDSRAFADALKGKEKLTRYVSETGEKVLCSYAPLEISRLNWIIVNQVDMAEAVASLNRFLFYMTGIALLIAGLLYYISGITNNPISRRLKSLTDITLALSNGEKIRLPESDTNDEIGQAVAAIGKLSRRVNEAAMFVNEMGKGNTDLEFRTENEDDQFGHSLKNLKKNLIHQREEEEKRKQEDEIRNWTTHGVAMFNDILRSDNIDLEKLAFNIIKTSIQYLSANQGGLFLIDGEGNDRYLNLVAAYAYDRQKFLQKKINIGEGLAGNCVLEKKTVLINKIPNDYIEISSGLGGAKPGCLLIVPLKKEEDVLGVLEIASFNVFKPHEVEFIEKVAESIAASLITVRLHQQTTQYLERFQQQAEEMKAQDEELRQNIEELQATHEQMERLKQEENERNQQMIKEMEDYRKLLLKVLDHIPGKIFVKDHDGKLLLLNSEVAKVYNKTVEELLGTSDFDNHPLEEAQEYRKNELEIISKGAKTYIQEESLTGSKKFLKTTKSPIFLPHLNKTGLLGIQLDVTDFVSIERENALKEEALQKEKALLDALLNNVPEHIYFKDKQSRFLRFSRSMLKLFGLEKPEELIGKSDFDFYPEEHARPAFEDEQEIIKTGKAIIDLEEKNVHEDGTASWVNTTKMPLVDSSGEIIGTFGISKDISNLKNLELKALDMAKVIDGNRKLLIDILDKVPAKVFLKDENGAFVVVNSAVASVYDKTPDQIIGTTDYDNHPNEDVDSWRKQEIEIMKEGTKVYVHSETDSKGVTRHLRTIKMPFMIATTGNIGLLGIQFDVTEQKLTEEKVHELKAELERARK